MQSMSPAEEIRPAPSVVGRRQAREQAAPGIAVAPMARINNRINNRIDRRTNKRIDYRDDVLALEPRKPQGGAASTTTSR